MANDVIKPCPFCGAPAEAQPSSTGTSFFVSCSRPRCADGPFMETREQAVAVWNRVSDAVASTPEPEPADELRREFYTGDNT